MSIISKESQHGEIGTLDFSKSVVGQRQSAHFKPIEGVNRDCHIKRIHTLKQKWDTETLMNSH